METKTQNPRFARTLGSLSVVDGKGKPPPSRGLLVDGLIFSSLSGAGLVVGGFERPVLGSRKGKST